MTQDNDDKAFTAWLENRRFEEPAADLSARIIRAAYSREQKNTFSLSEWLRRTFQEFHLPNPAYALAAVLVLGFAAGLTAPNATAETGENNSGLRTLLYVEGVAL